MTEHEIITDPRIEAIALLRDLATRADWTGIDSADIARRYSIGSRQLAYDVVKRYAMQAYKGVMTWRGPLLFAARELEFEAQ